MPKTFCNTETTVQSAFKTYDESMVNEKNSEND